MALFVFLAAAAGTRVVAADLGLVAAHLLDRIVAARARGTRRFGDGACTSARAAAGAARDGAERRRRRRLLGAQRDLRRTARRRLAHGRRVRIVPDDRRQSPEIPDDL